MGGSFGIPDLGGIVGGPPPAPNARSSAKFFADGFSKKKRTTHPEYDHAALAQHDDTSAIGIHTPRSDSAA